MPQVLDEIVTWNRGFHDLIDGIYTCYAPLINRNIAIMSGAVIINNNSQFWFQGSHGILQVQGHSPRYPVLRSGTFYALDGRICLHWDKYPDDHWLLVSYRYGEIEKPVVIEKHIIMWGKEGF